MNPHAITHYHLKVACLPIPPPGLIERVPALVPKTIIKWYPRRDLNPHAITHYHLKVACLPIPPPGLIERVPALVPKTIIKWYPRRDLNPHAITHYHLKVACLPIPPPGHKFHQTTCFQSAELYPEFQLSQLQLLAELQF